MGFESVHFIRPQWLLLAPLIAAIWFYLSRKQRSTNWESVLPATALAVLKIDGNQAQPWLKYWLLTAGLLLTIAAAGPSWIKQQMPALNNHNAVVVVLDLSPSMRSTDIQPDRITRARYELLDLIELVQDGQMGLVVYGGSAHAVSPVTDDPKTLSALVPALSPDIISEAGSNVEAAIRLAQDLLKDAGISGGHIVLMTDGVTEKASKEVQRILKRGRTLSILGIGGSDPTPIPSAEGGFVRDSNGEIVLTTLAVSALSRLAKASGGQFSTLSADQSDVKHVAQTNLVVGNNSNAESSNDSYDGWVDLGYLLVLLVMPLFIIMFRKGAVYGLLLFMVMPLPSEAQESSSFWSDLLRTPNQQAQALFDSGEHERAASKFENKNWSAAAHYRAGNYEQALTLMGEEQDVTSLYNKANAMAITGKLQEALDLYTQVLEIDDQHQDAAHNRKVVEELLKQQEQEQQQQQQQNQDNSEQDSEQSEQQNSDQQSDSEQQNEQQNSSESESESQSQSEQNSDSTASDQQGDNQDQQQQSDESDNDSEKQQASQDDPSDDTKDLSQQEQSQTQQEQPSEQQSNSQSQAVQAEPDQDQSQDQTSENQAMDVQAEEETEGDPLSESSEQWLRTIQEDPAGLLRRKFEYQAWQREQQRKQQSTNTKPTTEERY